MKSTSIGFPSKPTILALIGSTSQKTRCDPVKLWAVTPLTCQKCNYQTRVLPPSANLAHLSASYHRQAEFCRRSRSFLLAFGASRSSSSSSNDDNPLNKPRTDLPSHEEGRRSQVSKRLSHVMDHLQSNIFIAGKRLNDLTGYSGIEALKMDIEEQEKFVQTSRSSLQQAREAYTAAINSRSSSQREVNELLQRKHAWTSDDLERFTALYRSDHANEQSESAAQEQLAAAERKAEEAAAKLSASILARYHEEQIWSDKIRRMSTWGTWGLMGVNVVLFLVFQIGVEPWRRKRLVKGFEEKVLEALERESSPKGVAIKFTDMQNSQNLLTSGPAVDGVEKNIDRAVEPELPASMGKGTLDDVPSAGEALLAIELTTTARSSVFGTFKERVRDLFSDRPIVVRSVDVTTIALEGVAAGMTVVGLVVLLLGWTR